MSRKRRSYETGHQAKYLVIIDDTPECDRAMYYASRRAARAMMKAALISRRPAADALCTKQETWFIDPPFPLLIRNPCPPPILKSSILHSDGPSNTAFGKMPARRARLFLLLPERVRARPIRSPIASHILSSMAQTRAAFC